MKTILVTGGAGFIGSHLCDRLIDRGDQVLCLDNFFTGRKENITHLLQHPRFEVIRHDIVHPIFVEVDQIFNLACPASPIHYQHNPIKTIKTSTVGMVNVLGLAKRTGARILQASTSEVYGDPEVHPQPETYWGHVNPVGIRSCYDEGKRVAESLCMDYHRMNGVDIRIVRIFNTYGPRMDPDDGRVISNFVVQALKGESLTVYGDGSHTRSFCFIDDLLGGLLGMMDQEGCIGPLNLGNPHEISVKTLAGMVAKATGLQSPIQFRDLPQDDPRQRRPDISLAEEVLKWKPTVDLAEGLAKTIEYFKALKDERSSLPPGT